MATVYVTKHALTKGIIRYENAEVERDDFCMIRLSRYQQYFHRDEFWISESDARKHVEMMIARRIASLEKSIAKLRAHSVEVITVEGDRH